MLAADAAVQRLHRLAAKAGIGRGRSCSGAGSSRDSPRPIPWVSSPPAGSPSDLRLRRARDPGLPRSHGGAPGPGGAAQIDPAGRHPRCLGRARQPLQRRGGRGLRQCGLRPSGRSARCRNHGRHVHQYPAGARAGERRRAPGCLAATAPGAPARPPGIRAQPAGPDPALERDALPARRCSRRSMCSRTTPTSKTRRCRHAGSGGLRIANLRSFESTNYPLTLTLTAADQISLPPDVRPRSRGRRCGVTPAPTLRRAARRHGRRTGATPRRSEPAHRRGGGRAARLERDGHGLPPGPSPPRLDRGPDRPLAGRRGRRLRDRTADLRRARPPGGTPGAPVAGLRLRPGEPRRRAPRTLLRVARRAPRHPQGGGRLCPPGP